MRNDGCLYITVARRRRRAPRASWLPVITMKLGWATADRRQAERSKLVTAAGDMTTQLSQPLQTEISARQDKCAREPQPLGVHSLVLPSVCFALSTQQAASDLFYRQPRDAPGVGIAHDEAAEVADEGGVRNEELQKHEEGERVPGRGAGGVKRRGREMLAAKERHSAQRNARRFRQAARAPFGWDDEHAENTPLGLRRQVGVDDHKGEDNS